MQGTVLALALRPIKSQAVALQSSIEMAPEAGIIGDHCSSRRRQVSLLDVAAWGAACTELGVDLEWTARRSNILVSGLNLQTLVGSRIQLGSAIVEIIGEVVPCHVMDSAKNGLKSALKPEWRGGVYGRVVVPGKVEVGDLITIYSSQ